MTKHFSLLPFLLLIFSLAPITHAYELTINYQHQTNTLTQAQVVTLSGDSLTTITPWTNEASKFEGILLSKLMNHFNIKSTKLKAKALNGYQVTIDLQQAIASGAFVAANENGKAMKVRNKGPFWLIFPWYKSHIMKDKRFQDWGVWQLTEFTFEPIE